MRVDVRKSSEITLPKCGFPLAGFMLAVFFSVLWYSCHGLCVCLCTQNYFKTSQLLTNSTCSRASYSHKSK